MMRRVFLLYALSGFLSLAYQVAWFRIFTDWFGSTSLTFALVVSCFIGGLATGALLSEQISRGLSVASGIRDGLRAYGLIEIAVSVTVMLTVLAGLIPADTWGSFPYHLRDGIWFQSLPYKASQLLIAAICVFIPCVFMGVSFPLLCEISAARQQSARFPSVLYAWNTLGACVGVLACQFALIPWLGHERMFQWAAALNFALGIYFLSTGGAFRLGESPESEPLQVKSQESGARAPAALLAFALLGGFVAGSLEGDLFKRLSFLLDFNAGATMAFISFWVIAAIFLASFLVRAASDRLRLPHIKIAFCLAWVSYIAVWFGRDEIHAAMTEALRQEANYIFPDSMAKLLVFVGIYAFVPYFLISLLLPYICNRLQSGRRHLGTAYGLNTLAFCAGLILFTLIAPRLNIFYSLRLFLAVFAICGVVLIALSEHELPRSWKLASAGVAMLACAIFTPTGFAPSYFLPNTAPRLFPAHAVKSNGTDTTFVVEYGDPGNNAGLYFGRMVMSGTGFAAESYMRLMAHFPLLVHPEPKSALLICFGVGSTASAIAAHEGIDSIDIVDLNHNADLAIRTLARQVPGDESLHSCVIPGVVGHLECLRYTIRLPSPAECRGLP